MTETQAQLEGAVRRVALPAEARAQSTLAHVDYEDAHVVDLPQAQQRSAEEWARAVLEESSETVRASLRSGWRALGMRVGPLHTEGYVLLGGTSRLGMQAELLVERREGELLFATLVQFDNVGTQTLWTAAIEGPHIKVVRHVLEEARRRWA